MVRPISELVKLYTSAAPAQKGNIDPTAEKIIPIGKELIGKQNPSDLRDRQIAQLNDVDDLSSKVLSLKNGWNELAPDEIAAALSDLEGKISLFTNEEKICPAIQKVQNEFDKCVFKFVFPLAIDLDASEEHSFAKSILGMAKEILKNQSLDSFRELNGIQQWEISRYARGNR